MTTKRALIKELAQRMECTDVAAKKFLNSYIELITEKLSEGEGVRHSLFWPKWFPITKQSVRDVTFVQVKNVKYAPAHQ